MKKILVVQFIILLFSSGCYYDKYNKEVKEEKVNVIKKESINKQKTIDTVDNLKLF